MKKYIRILLAICVLAIAGGCGLKKQVSVNGNYEPTQGKILIIQTNQYLPENISYWLYCCWRKWPNSRRQVYI